MNFNSLTPRVRAALKQLAAGPQDMRDEALLQQINDEMKKLPVEETKARKQNEAKRKEPPRMKQKGKSLPKSWTSCKLTAQRS